MPYFSIIIPIYNNGREEIAECFRSIKEQSCTDFEVIIIDDGSGKKCAKDIDCLAKYFLKEYQVIHIPNGGVSNARNLGISVARGEYVTFVDGDDFICPTMLMDAYQILGDNKLDILYGMVRSIHKNQNISSDSQNDKVLSKFVILDESGCEDLYCHMFDISENRFKFDERYVGRGPVGKFIKKQIATDNLFNTKLSFGEDEEWNLRILSKKPYAGYINRLWYYYVYRKNSALHKFSFDFIKKHEERLSVMWRYVKDRKTERCYLSESLHIIKELLPYYYFSGYYKKGLKERFYEFDALSKRFPWNAAYSLENLIHLGWKKQIIYFLLRTKILFFIYYLKCL